MIDPLFTVSTKKIAVICETKKERVRVREITRSSSQIPSYAYFLGSEGWEYAHIRVL